MARIGFEAVSISPEIEILLNPSLCLFGLDTSCGTEERLNRMREFTAEFLNTGAESLDFPVKLLTLLSSEEPLQDVCSRQYVWRERE